MKITKKSFIGIMTDHETTFIGVTRKLLTSDEVYCKIADLLKSDYILEKRTCYARSNDIVFSGGSILDFNQNGKYTFYNYEYPTCSILVCCHETYDPFDECYHERCMYYMIED